MSEAGINWYVGVPGSGKTTLAIRKALEEVKATGRPLLIIDTEGVALPVAAPDGFRYDLPFSKLDEVEGKLWTEGAAVRVLMQSEDHVTWLVKLVCGGRDVVVVFDEISYYSRGAGLNYDLGKLLRMHRHYRVSLHATTQYVGDIAPVALQCADTVFAFRTTAARALERLEEEYRLPAEKLMKLERGEFLSWRKWD
jgi:DNA helicase HerA-like ATPase